MSHHSENEEPMESINEPTVEQTESTTSTEATANKAVEEVGSVESVQASEPDVAEEPAPENVATKSFAAKPTAPVVSANPKDKRHVGLLGPGGRGRRKVRLGTVVSDKMDKTVVVSVERRLRHPLYGKIMRRTQRYKAHDEKNECGIGDLVQIMETRPISREKRWRISKIVEKAK